MNVKVENIEKNVVQLEIEVDAEKFEEGMQKSYLRNKKRFNVPGFRKGKAPRNIIERYYGEEILYEDAVNIIFPEVYDEAVKQSDIHPVERPEVDIKQIGSGKNLIITAKVTVKPEVELGQYKGIEVEKIDATVTDEDVENELKKNAEKNSRLVTVEDRPIQSGDIAVIDFEGFIDGVPFEGGKGTDYDLVIGSGQFIPGFEDQLIGAEKGSEVEVNVTFPEDYGNKELAGKAALFKVKVKEIKVKELPEIDDEFAKDVSEFETLAEYKEDLRKKLIEEAENRAKRQTEENIIEKVVNNATIDLPRVMVENHIDRMVEDFDWRLRYQGLDINKYLEIMGMDMETFRKQFEERAEKEIRTQLVLEKISEVEKIEATEEQINEEIAKIAESSKQNVEDFRKQMGDEYIEYIKRNIIIKNTVDMLVKEAKIA